MAAQSSNPPPDVATYRALFAEAQTHYERAEIERGLTDEIIKSGGSSRGYRTTAELLGAKFGEVVRRLSLLNKLTALEWAYVETFPSVSYAYETFLMIGLDGLTDYATGSDEKRQAVRRAINTARNARRPSTVSQTITPTSTPQPAAPKRSTVRKGPVWPEIHADVIDRLGLAADHPLRARFDRDLAALFATWSEEIRNDRKRKTASAELPELPKPISSRKRVVEACRVLAMDPPKPNQPADLAAARRAQRRLARLYHPDANGGDSSKLEAFHAVNDAFRLLETYNQTTLGEQSNVEEKPE